MKRFKPSDEAEIIFHRERLLLEAIRRRPHNHILTHITSIKDHDTFYILFPLAQCNLRTFLNRTTAPGLHGNGVIWFFSQLKGLADALLHLHTLGDCGSKPRWTRDHNFIPSNPVLHGDIKPENILVYTSTSEASLWTFKLCDFGTAQNSNQSEKCITHQNIFFRGTQAYESPDLLKSNELSCMTDVYALGCVVLELFVWLFYPPGSEEIGFMTQRACDTLSSSSSFWKLEENGEVDLKPSVKRRLLDMEYTPCCGKLSFEYLLNMLWSVVYPLDHNKYSTVRFLNDIEASMAQAELDLSRNPNHFLDSTARSRGYATPLPSWISEMPDSFYEPPAERKPFKKDRRAFWNKLAHYSKLEKERAQQQAQHV